MPLRAFVGVPVAPEPRLVLILDALRESGVALKIVDPDALHITIAFLGDVADDAPARLAPALDAATRGVAPLRLQLKGVGAFPNVNHPRVVWVGVEDPRAVTQLALRVRAGLKAAGLSFDEKDFRAHVTLARSKSDQGAPAIVPFLKEHGRDELGDAPVDVVRLYKSTLGRKGPSYEVLHGSKLEAAP